MQVCIQEYLRMYKITIKFYLMYHEILTDIVLIVCS